MKRGNRWVRLICAAGGLAVLGACAGGDRELPATVRSAKAVNATEIGPVTDIPIPEGARLDTKQSLILSSGNKWTGRIVMKVDQSPVKAFAFYQREMPAFRWSPVMSVQSEISVLTFTREERVATVQIQARTIGGTIVIVTIAPSQAGQPTSFQVAPRTR